MPITSEHVYVEKSKIAEGYGVFAKESIKKNAVIEICPAVFMPINEFDHIKKTKLHFYFFEYSKKEIMIVLGYGSLYNHSYTPNAKYSHDYKKRTFRVMALRRIEKGEEITFNYNYFPKDQTPLASWYKVGIDV